MASGILDADLAKIKRNYASTSSARQRERTLRTSGGTPMQLTLIRARQQTLRSTRTALVDTYLQRINKQIDTAGFRLQFAFDHRRAKRDVYVRDSDPAMFFASKGIEYDIRRAFGMRLPDRDQIVAQLKGVLHDDFPKTVVRGDVASFYESIPHSKMLDVLREHRNVSTTSVRMVKRLLDDYEVRTGRPIGLPRGMSLSATLAEAYMFTFDLQMSTRPETIYFARFVDDVVWIADYGDDPAPAARTPSIAQLLQARDLTLSTKAGKAYEKSYRRGKNLPPFTFLGYEIEHVGAEVHARMSSKRAERLAKRLRTAFDVYNFSSKKEGRAGVLLFKRVRYLTSNTRLRNSKRSAYIGVRFSNRHIDDLGQLAKLDNLLATLATGIAHSGLRRRISGMSFEGGFAQSRFVKTSIRDFTEITSIWSRLE